MNLFGDFHLNRDGIAFRQLVSTAELVQKQGYFYKILCTCR